MTPFCIFKEIAKGAAADTKRPSFSFLLLLPILSIIDTTFTAPSATIVAILSCLLLSIRTTTMFKTPSF